MSVAYPPAVAVAVWLLTHILTVNVIGQYPSMAVATLTGGTAAILWLRSGLPDANRTGI